MDELIPVKSSGYARYEELLLERDALKKETGSMMTAYIREFGELITDVFAAKIEAIRLKKSITICQMSINRGAHVNPAEMEARVKEMMQGYYEQLKAMLADNKAAKDAKTIPEHVLYKVKKLYRRLAMLIHPDLNPKTAGDENLSELWQRLTAAYNASDLSGMEELVVLIKLAVSDGGETPEIENVEEKISELEAEIDEIRTTDPYLYKDLLSDKEAVEEKKESLRKELQEYKDYASELQDTLNKMMLMAGVDVTWQEN